MRHRPKRHRVVGVDDVPGDFVVLVGHHGLVEQVVSGTSVSVIWATTRSRSAAATPRWSPDRSGGFGEQVFQVLKPVGDSAHGVAEMRVWPQLCCLRQYDRLNLQAVFRLPSAAVWRC
jgi:hypothetical protein